MHLVHGSDLCRHSYAPQPVGRKALGQEIRDRSQGHTLPQPESHEPSHAPSAQTSLATWLCTHAKTASSNLAVQLVVGEQSNRTPRDAQPFAIFHHLNRSTRIRGQGRPTTPAAQTRCMTATFLRATSVCLADRFCTARSAKGRLGPGRHRRRRWSRGA